MKITKLLMEELWLVFVFLHDIAGVCLTPEAILALESGLLVDQCWPNQSYGIIA